MTQRIIKNDALCQKVVEKSSNYYHQVKKYFGRSGRTKFCRFEFMTHCVKYYFHKKL